MNLLYSVVSLLNTKNASGKNSLIILIHKYEYIYIVSTFVIECHSIPLDALHKVLAMYISRRPTRMK